MLRAPDRRQVRDLRGLSQIARGDGRTKVERQAKTATNEAWRRQRGSNRTASVSERLIMQIRDLITELQKLPPCDEIKIQGEHKHRLADFDIYKIKRVNEPGWAMANARTYWTLTKYNTPIDEN